MCSFQSWSKNNPILESADPLFQENRVCPERWWFILNTSVLFEICGCLPMLAQMKISTSQTLSKKVRVVSSSPSIFPYLSILTTFFINVIKVSVLSHRKRINWIAVFTSYRLEIMKPEKFSCELKPYYNRNYRRRVG